jgi:hypothetical protein
MILWTHRLTVVSPGERTMPKPKKPAKPAPDRHREPVVGFRPPSAMRDILRELAHKERRTVSKMLELLMEEALVARALWPPTG